jgi:ABC-2 type transport system permease protein
MVRKIARKEMTEMVRDGRFRWAAATVLLLLVCSLILGLQQMREARAQGERAQSENWRQWLEQGERNPHSAAHFGVHAFKPTMALAFFDRGLDPYLGTSVWLEAHFQDPLRYRPAQDATAAQRFGELTASTVLQVLLPLLIILLAFASLSGEREAGTLRQVLSLGVSRRELALGKSLGVAGALGLLVVPAGAVGVLALALTTPGGALLASLPRFGVLLVAYLLYFAGFLGLTLAVSALAPSSRLALMLLTGFWIVNCLLIPRAVSELAERRYPTPTATEFWDRVAVDIAKGFDGHNPDPAKLARLEERVKKQYGVTRLEELPINFAGIRFQAGEDHGNTVFDHHYGELWRTYRSQERLYQLAAPVAPFLAIRFLSMGLAGTDLAQHRHFATAAERYRRMLNRKMNEAILYKSRTGDAPYFDNQTLWSSVPEFRYTAPDLSWVLRREIWNLAVLFAWTLAAGAAALLAGARMSVL